MKRCFGRLFINIFSNIYSVLPDLIKMYLNFVTLR